MRVARRMVGEEGRAGGLRACASEREELWSRLEHGQ